MRNMMVMPAKPLSKAQLRNKTKEKTKLKLENSNKALCYWITVLKSDGIDAYSGKPLQQPVIVHHLIHKVIRAMRYELEDLFAMYLGNHFLLHKRTEPEFVARVIKMKGQKWFDALLLKAHDATFRYTIEYLENKQQRLVRVFNKAFGIDWDEFKRYSKTEKWHIVYNKWE